MKNELNKTQAQTYTEQRAVVGGGFNTYQIEKRNTFRGEVLGAELTDAHVLTVLDCDHIESSDEDGIEIARGVWAKKSLIKSLHYQCDQFAVKTVCRVEFARPL